MQPQRNITNYPTGFTGPVAIRGIPLLNTHGAAAMWVDSNGTSSGAGTWQRPYASLVAAVAKANADDIILCKPNHQETIVAAAGIDLSVAGLSVIGLGNGRRKPIINFTTAAAATVKLSAADVRLQNFRLTCGIANQVTMLDLQAKRATVEGCDFAEGTATGLSFIAVTAAANVADEAQILNNTFYNPTAGNMNHAIGLNTVQDNVVVSGNVIRGNFALSGIHNVVGQVLTNLRLLGNKVKNLTAGKQGMNLISACTGDAYDNEILPGDATVDAAVFGSLTGTGNQGLNGSLDAGSTFTFAKSGLVSSAVTTAGVDISAVSTGALVIEDVIAQTDGTGLAAGTNFTVQHNNVKGAAVFFAETVANLGASKTVDLTGASVTKIRNVLESGKKLTAKCTVANCTGAGLIDVFIRFKRLTLGANILAV
jgi:hypothetical protein